MRKTILLSAMMLTLSALSAFAQDADGHFFINVPVTEQVAGDPLTQCLKYLPNIKEGTTLTQTNDEIDSVGIHHLYVEQYVGGIKQEEKALRLHVKNNILLALNGQVTVKDVTSQAKPANAANAGSMLSAKDALAKAGYMTVSAELVNIDINSVTRTAYMFMWGPDKIYVDAYTGEILKKESMLRYSAYSDGEEQDAVGKADLYFNGQKDMTSVKMNDGSYVLHDNGRKIYTYNVSDEAFDSLNYHNALRDIIKALGDNPTPEGMAKYVSAIYDSLYIYAKDFKSSTPDWLGHQLCYANTQYYVPSKAFPDADDVKLKIYRATADKEIVETVPLDISYGDTTVILTLKNPLSFSVDTTYIANLMPYKEEVLQKLDMYQFMPVSGATPQTIKTIDNALDVAQKNVLTDFQPALDAHWGMQQVYDFYKEQFGRISFDGKGTPLRQYFNPSVTFPIADMPLGGTPFNSSACPGHAEGIMFYGTGFPKYNMPLEFIDIMGHEFTHLVANTLKNKDEAGALNEGFADIMGYSVKVSVTGVDDWKWSAGLVGTTGRTTTVKTRDLADPHSVGCPATYKGEYWINAGDPTDNGGVHTDCLVLTHWYYLLCTGGTYEDSLGVTKTITPINRQNAMRIAFYTLVGYEFPYMNFHDTRKATICEASALYGADSQQVKSIKAAWDAVKVYGDADEQPTPVKEIVSAKVCTSDSKMYNTAGIAVDDSYKGIVISKGKKSVK